MVTDDQKIELAADTEYPEHSPAMLLAFARACIQHAG
jgi:hypothetical protein